MLTLPRSEIPFYSLVRLAYSFYKLGKVFWLSQQNKVLQIRFYLAFLRRLCIVRSLIGQLFEN